MKSTLGGLITILIYYYVAYKGLERGLQMVIFTDPSIKSVTKKYDSTEVVRFNDITSKLIFSISPGGHNPWGATDIFDDESR